MNSIFQKLKEKLKSIQFIYSLNAFLKAGSNTRKTKALYSYYGKRAADLNLKYSESGAVKMVRDRLAERGIRINPLARGKLRIFWVGAHYSQDASGFLDGLKSFGEVITFQNEESGYGLLFPQTSKTKMNKLQVLESNSRSLLKQVIKVHQNRKIDLLMGQMWVDVLDVEALIKIQGMGIPTVNISMDDKLPDLWRKEKRKLMGSVGLANGLDLVLTTSPDTCLWYAVEGCQAIYWPLASDTKMFFPREPKIYDVVFVGGRYGIRGKLVQSIMATGINIEAFGPGFPNGFINADKIAEVFGKAKIILGSGYVAYNTDILTIKLRDFDATMAGGLYLTNRNPELLRLFEEGKEIECYDTIDECISKIKFYLANPDKLKAVAEAGLKKARENYTWEKNIGNALKFIGLID